MNREQEKNVLMAICNFSDENDYENTQDVQKIINKIGDSKAFLQSMYGKRYLDRLNCIDVGLASQSCIVCGRMAENHVICSKCTQTMKQYMEKYQISVEQFGMISNHTKSRNDSASVGIEDLFKDMDDSLMQLASKKSVRTIKRMQFINITISIINTIAIFFLALFLWKFIVSQ